MERRHFLKIAFGAAAGTAVLAAGAKAAPLAPQSIAGDQLPAAPEQPELRPAVTSADEVSRLQPEQVRWGHHWHHHWHRRHWGWHRWHHRRWHRHWHRHRW